MFGRQVERTAVRAPVHGVMLRLCGFSLQARVEYVALVTPSSRRHVRGITSLGISTWLPSGSERLA